MDRKPDDRFTGAAFPPLDGASAEPTHSEDGVDLTLIRWMLSMTPTQRLQTLQQHARFILRLRHARSRPGTSDSNAPQ
jgi:hypothetical protein